MSETATTIPETVTMSGDAMMEMIAHIWSLSAREMILHGRHETLLSVELDGLALRLFREMFGREWGDNDELEAILQRREYALTAEWAFEWTEELRQEVAEIEGRLARDMK